MEQLEKFFEDLFTKKIAWQIPAKGKEFIVQIAPWVAIIIAVLSIPAILAIFGIGSFFGSLAFSFGVSMGFKYYVGIAILAVQVILMFMAFPGLKDRKIKGWKYIYYSDLISGVYGIVSAYGVGDAIGSLLGTAIGLFILFQVKSYYK